MTALGDEIARIAGLIERAATPLGVMGGPLMQYAVELYAVREEVDQAIDGMAEMLMESNREDSHGG